MQIRVGDLENRQTRKAGMAEYLAEVFARQYEPIDVEIWIEPFAGGAGAGLALPAPKRGGGVCHMRTSGQSAGTLARLSAGSAQ